MNMSQLFRAFEIFKKYGLNPKIYLDACDSEFIYISARPEGITDEDIHILEEMGIFVCEDSEEFFFFGQ